MKFAEVRIEVYPRLRLLALFAIHVIQAKTIEHHESYILEPLMHIGCMLQLTQVLERMGTHLIHMRYSFEIDKATGFDASLHG